MSPEVIVLIVIVIAVVGLTLLTQRLVDYFRYKTKRKIKPTLEAELAELQNNLADLKKEYHELETSTRELKELRSNSELIANEAKEKQAQLQSIIIKIDSIKEREQFADAQIHAFQSKVDLYSRLDDFVDYGFFERPEYLYETSERFAIEIKKVREQQKELIRSGSVIIGPREDKSWPEFSFLSKILNAQEKLIVKGFNIECDLLISKVNPSNIERTVERIRSIADELEKLMADLRFGFNNKYIQLKIDECRIQYQFTLKKKEEQEEQKAIREQMREEEKARREYEAALIKAQKDEDLYQSMLEKARKALDEASSGEREAAELRIRQLEIELEEAKEKAQRAISMAQQTKKGHVYVISNIGSFGEDVYKIGLTRRLDPTERVRELGDASVPFSFDIHAMISSDDAPALEAALHTAFAGDRVNAVNLRKEFFRVSLDSIRDKVSELTENKAEFTMTALADEYFQSKRLNHEESAHPA